MPRGTDKQVRLWDTNSGTAVKTLAGHMDDVYRVQFNPTGTRLLSIGYAGTLTVWNVADGEGLLFTKKMTAPDGKSLVLFYGSYTPDGKRRRRARRTARPTARRPRRSPVK